jgi:hypothetical protein
MAEGTLILLHSPLTGLAVWGDLTGALQTRGAEVQSPEVLDDDDVPYSVRYVARASLQVSGDGPFIAVGHGAAGALLGQFGHAQRAWRRSVCGYVFLDAGLPRPGGVNRLEMLRTEDPKLSSELDESLHGRARFPNWTERDLHDEVPDAAARQALLAGARPRPREFFTEAIPCPADWPDAPCGYLQTSSTYDVPARVARERGWPVRSYDGGHFAALADPEKLADELVALVAQL